MVKSGKPGSQSWNVLGKMREKVALIGWLTPLYLVCDLCQSAYSNSLIYILWLMEIIKSI